MSLFYFLCGSLALTTPLTTRFHHASDKDEILQCWDNCFDETVLETLLQGGATRRHGFTSVIDRRQSQPRSTLEAAICSLLNEIGDDSNPFIEYWWRDASPPRMLEAHRDIDETLCCKHQRPVALGSEIKIGRQTCPSFGHVLYVHVDLGVCAPTLVWQEEGNGGGPPRELQKLWSIPAVTNRLLRFRGDCLHAVAYPPLAFLNGEYFMEGLAQEKQRRAVLLFNTWKEPPLYPAVGEELSSAETDLLSKSETCVKCRSSQEWETCVASVANDSTYQEELVPMKVPLLGDVSRRACIEDTLISYVDKALAVSALTSLKHVHSVDLFSVP